MWTKIGITLLFTNGFIFCRFLHHHNKRTDIETSRKPQSAHAKRMLLPEDAVTSVCQVHLICRKATLMGVPSAFALERQNSVKATIILLGAR